MTTAILPTPESIVTPAIDAMARLRPKVRRHIERGRYGDIAHGWAGEARVLRADLAQLTASRFLGTAEGQALVSLVRSDEFGAPVITDPTYARGRLLLRREDDGEESTSGALWDRGEIPRGTKFRINADPKAIPPVQESTVEAIETVAFDDASTVVDSGGGSFHHTQDVWVPVRSVTAGAGPNIRVYAPEAAALTGQSLSQLFDTRLQVVGAELAGGGEGLSEDTLRRAGTAAYLGRHGATDRALILGAFCTGMGVEHLAPVEDITNGISQLFIADASWAANTVWCAEVQRAIVQSGWLGFGCRVRVLPVNNAIVHVEGTVRLRDTRFAEERTELSNAVTESVREYFDRRTEFWTFDTGGLATSIARADRRRILSVPTAPVVRSLTGAVLAPPDGYPTNVSSVAHAAVRSLQLTFQRPNGSEI